MGVACSQIYWLILSFFNWYFSVQQADFDVWAESNCGTLMRVILKLQAIGSDFKPSNADETGWDAGVFPFHSYINRSFETFPLI